MLSQTASLRAKRPVFTVFHHSRSHSCWPNFPVLLCFCNKRFDSHFEVLLWLVQLWFSVMCDLSAKSLLVVTHKRNTFTQSSIQPLCQTQRVNRTELFPLFPEKSKSFPCAISITILPGNSDNCWKCHLCSESVRDTRNLTNLACLSQATINLWLWGKISLLLLPYTSSKR